MSAKLVTFDVYMALIDIQGSLSPVVAECLAIPIDKAGKIVRAWRAKQMERAAASNSLAGERTSFRDCTRMGLDYVLGRNGYDLPGADRECLVAAWDGISPWPEARDVVAEVKERGFETAILSNGDQDMLDALAQGFGDDLDHVLSSETAGAYKPDPSVYELPTRLLNVEKANVLAWRLSNTMDASFCVEALNEALARHGRPGSQSPWLGGAGAWTTSFTNGCGVRSNMKPSTCTS